jgi:hypothetical protein
MSEQERTNTSDQLRLAAHPKHRILSDGLARRVVHKLRACGAYVDRPVRGSHTKEQGWGRFSRHRVRLLDISLSPQSKRRLQTRMRSKVLFWAEVRVGDDIG